MSGIIAWITGRGRRVGYLTVTDGALGDLGLCEGPLAEIRAKEAGGRAASGR